MLFLRFLIGMSQLLLFKGCINLFSHRVCGAVHFFICGTTLDIVTHFFWSNYLFFYYYFLNFYCYSVTVVCLFSPSLHPTPAEPTSLPHLHPPPWFCPCVLYSSSSCNPFLILGSLIGENSIWYFIIFWKPYALSLFKLLAHSLCPLFYRGTYMSSF